MNNVLLVMAPLCNATAGGILARRIREMLRLQLN
jgi:hypothetical protein